MTEVLLTPDTEAAAVAFLKVVLAGAVDRVATKIPATMPARMVKVTGTGSARIGVASDFTQLTVECWGLDDPATSLIARTAYANMLAAAGAVAGGVFVRRAETVGGVQNFPDPDTNKPRYIFTVRWHVKPATI